MQLDDKYLVVITKDDNGVVKKDVAVGIDAETELRALPLTRRSDTTFLTEVDRKIKEH